MLILSETKLDESFTKAQFQIPNYSLHRLDRNDRGGGIIVYVNNIIPHCYRTDFHCLIKNGVEGLVFEMTLSKKKWFVVSLYKPPNVRDVDFISMLITLVEELLKESCYIVILGDVNINMNVNNKLSDACCILGLKNLITGNTCYKSEAGTAIDVILVSNKYCFCDSINECIGISDFHNIIGCVLKAHAPERIYKRVSYRSYRNLSENGFRKELVRFRDSLVQSFDVNEKYNDFVGKFCSLLDKHVPLKSKTITKISPPYMNDKLRKSIYKKCMLRTKYMKCKTSFNWEAYRKQRNLVTAIRRQSIRNYFQKQTSVVNGKTFWKTIKPFLTEKSSSGNDEIILREDSRILTDPQDICSVFNNFYTSAADSIGFNDEIPWFADSNDLLTYIVNKYSAHPSILAIKARIIEGEHFSFDLTNENEVSKILTGLNIKKAIGYDGIPPKIIKTFAIDLTPIITKMINDCIENCIFPDQLKLAEVSSVFKKNDRLCKENYRPISILVIISKVYEKIFVKRMSSFMSYKFNPLLSAYRTGYGCNDILLKFTSLWKKALDDNLYTGAIMMDLSKAFDCLPHCLLIAKFYAYGFSHQSCLLVASYLSSRKQRVKIGSERSSWNFLNKGVPQGSIMGPFLFNFFIHDLYYFIETCTLLNYADDDTLVFAHKNIHVVYAALSSDANVSVKWFEDNGMKANPEKFQFIISHRNVNVDDPIQISEMLLHPENNVKLLGIIIDKMLTFDRHVESLCKKASKQLNALKRFSHILGEKQKFSIFLDIYYIKF